VYNTSEGLDDMNSADILSRAVNSILPQWWFLHQSWCHISVFCCNRLKEF
jgi:hypothetical protein